MPKFTSENTTNGIQNTFSFSAVDLSTLGATEYTLVAIITDTSGSVFTFAREEEEAIKGVIGACRKSPRADNLMLRMTRFDTSVEEVHGFKLLQDCNPADYDGVIRTGGMTALYDAAIDGIDALSRYGKELQKNDFSVNGIAFVITDGQNNAGVHLNPRGVKEAISRALSGENLESIQTILIGVNVGDPTLEAYLKNFAADTGFSQYVELKDANAATLAKLAAFVSKSISSQSMALGTGGPSQTLSF
jgi:hypothetical protein